MPTVAAYNFLAANMRIMMKQKNQKSIYNNGVQGHLQRVHDLQSQVISAVCTPESEPYIPVPAATPEAILACSAQPAMTYHAGGLIVLAAQAELAAERAVIAACKVLPKLGGRRRRKQVAQHIVVIPTIQAEILYQDIPEAHTRTMLLEVPQFDMEATTERIVEQTVFMSTIIPQTGAQASRDSSCSSHGATAGSARSRADSGSPSTAPIVAPQLVGLAPGRAPSYEPALPDPAFEALLARYAAQDAANEAALAALYAAAWTDAHKHRETLQSFSLDSGCTQIDSQTSVARGCSRDNAVMSPPSRFELPVQKHADAHKHNVTPKPFSFHKDMDMQTGVAMADALIHDVTLQTSSLDASGTHIDDQTSVDPETEHLSIMICGDGTGRMGKYCTRRRLIFQLGGLSQRELWELTQAAKHFGKDFFASTYYTDRHEHEHEYGVNVMRTSRNFHNMKRHYTVIDDTGGHGDYIQCHEKQDAECFGKDSSAVASYMDRQKDKT